MQSWNISEISIKIERQSLDHLLHSLILRLAFELYNDVFTSFSALVLRCSGSFRNKPILVIDFDWFTDKVILFNIWHDLRKILTLHIFAYIEEKICAFLVDLILIDFLPVQVVVSVPLVFKWILGVAYIVAEAELSVVIHDAVQIVSWLNI